MVENHRPAIIVHGGAGSIPEEELPDRLDGCKEAALEGWKVLDQGGAALEAVEVAVTALEDNPLFNAGIGSSLNALGEAEMDAAIMAGRDLSAGAVAAVKSIKNPIRLARRVLEDGRHLLLAGNGALSFARQAGFPECSPESLIVETQRRRWREKHGTVGCVALDGAGNLAAGTSTGGAFDKLPGRVGDSPLIGCGTYANDVAGVSCTGDGEAIIRTVMGKTASEFIRDGCDPAEAAERAVALLEEKTGARAGLIIVDRQGRSGYARNTARMPVCLISDGAKIVTDQ